MTPVPETGTVMLRLSPTEQWTVHHVLLDRIELERRSPANTEPPPVEVFDVFEKIEAGDSWFTPNELHSTRLELEGYLDRAVTSPEDRAAVERVVDLVEDVLAGRHPHHRPLRSRPR